MPLDLFADEKQEQAPLDLFADEKVSAPPQEQPRDFSRFMASPQSSISAQNLRGLVNEQIPVLGAIAGGALGSGVGPAGTLGGAGLGYSIGNYIIRSPATAEQGLQRIPGEVATGMTMEMGGQVLGNLFAKYAIPSAQKFASTIRGYYEKAIRPQVGVQRTAAQADQYFGRVTDAVETIVGNRENLKLVDDQGNLVAGKLPTSVKEFSQAVDQTKRQVFSEYDALARQAGRQQVQIDLQPIAKDMMALRNDQVLQTMSPQALDYAGAAAQRLATQGSFSPSQAQEAIGIANQSLRAFYKNPTYETATKAWVDASVAQKLRTALDTAIESATGAEYQQLKNLYGSLRAIEEDVSKRAAVEARKNVKGFFSLPDIWGGAELARGFLTAEPGSAVAGATAKGLSKYYRWLNSPDRQVNAMFNKASSMMEVMGKTGQRVYSDPIDQSGTIPSPDYKMIEWEGMGRPAEGTPIREGAPLPTTGLGMPDVNIGPPAWQAPQIVTRSQPTPPYAKTGLPFGVPEEATGQALRPGEMRPDVTVAPRAPEIVYRPGTAPESAKVGEPLIRRGEPAGQAVIPARIGGVQGEIRLGKGGNTIEFVPLSEAESRLGLKPGWAYSGEPRGPEGIAKNLGLEYGGKQGGAGKIPSGHTFTDTNTGSTFVVRGDKITQTQVEKKLADIRGGYEVSLDSVRDAWRKLAANKGYSNIAIADIADELGVSADKIIPLIRSELSRGAQSQITGTNTSWTLGEASVSDKVKRATMKLRHGLVSDIRFD